MFPIPTKSTFDDKLSVLQVVRDASSLLLAERSERFSTSHTSTPESLSAMRYIAVDNYTSGHILRKAMDWTNLNAEMAPRNIVQARAITRSFVGYVGLELQ